MDSIETLALVAHDGMKDRLVDWAGRHREALSRRTLYATGTTGGRLVDGLGLEVTRLRSGPLGGDAQLGAMIAEGRLDGLVFFIDPLSALPHDVDVKSLLRLATLYDTALAINERTANALLAAG
ncbi:methylglyoxal synthase [Roseobacter sp. HKCCA0434]|uniref:methylglyoxal synthase n=1 Tax=Roseobacter sp. HKCCA0434 TaxID=3079297 RepID=UPI002905C382|nr:methylglyoxal synthase [Roseobacter sp. HKCCA0434]